MPKSPVSAMQVWRQARIAGGRFISAGIAARRNGQDLASSVAEATRQATSVFSPRVQRFLQAEDMPFYIGAVGMFTAMGVIGLAGGAWDVAKLSGQGGPRLSAALINLGLVLAVDVGLGLVIGAIGILFWRKWAKSDEEAIATHKQGGEDKGAWGQEVLWAQRCWARCWGGRVRMPGGVRRTARAIMFAFDGFHGALLSFVLTVGGLWLIWHSASAGWRTAAVNWIALCVIIVVSLVLLLSGGSIFFAGMGVGSALEDLGRASEGQGLNLKYRSATKTPGAFLILSLVAIPVSGMAWGAFVCVAVALTATLVGLIVDCGDWTQLGVQRRITEQGLALAQRFDSVPGRLVPPPPEKLLDVAMVILGSPRRTKDIKLMGYEVARSGTGGAMHLLRYVCLSVKGEIYASSVEITGGPGEVLACSSAEGFVFLGPDPEIEAGSALSMLQGLLQGVALKHWDSGRVDEAWTTDRLFPILDRAAELTAIGAGSAKISQSRAFSWR